MSLAYIIVKLCALVGMTTADKTLKLHDIVRSIAERLSARLMIVHSDLVMGIYIYIYMSVTLLRMRRHVRIPTVRSIVCE